MRRFIAVTAFVFLLVAASSSFAGGYTGWLGLGCGGGIAQLGGDDISNYDWGPNFGAHVKYGVIPNLSLIGEFNYTWNSWSEDSKARIVYMPVAVGAIWDFASLMPPETKFVPYIEAGTGWYMWKSQYDGETVVLPNNEKVEGSSFGLNFGTGVEIFPMPSLGISPNIKWHYVFSRDQDKFGNEDDNEYLLDGGVGITWYWPIVKTPTK
jgi:hypothetical protein